MVDGADLDASAAQPLAAMLMLVSSGGRGRGGARPRRDRRRAPGERQGRRPDSGVSARFSVSEAFPDASIQNVGRLALYHASTAFLPADTVWLDTCFARVASSVVAQECQLPDCAAALAHAVDQAEVTDTWSPTTGTWDVAVVARGPDGGTVGMHVTRGMFGDAGAVLAGAAG